MQCKRPRLDLLFPVLLASLVGCTRQPLAEVPPPVFKCAHLKIACPDEATASVAAIYSRPWTTSQKASLEVLRYPAPGPPPEQADIWVLRPTAMPELAEAGLLREVPAEWTASDSRLVWSSILPIYRQHLLTWGRSPTGTPAVFALPLLGEAPLLLYRSDWLADENYRAAFRQQYNRELRPPLTWLEFEQIATFFSRSEPGPARPSLPPLPADDEGLERTFFQVAASLARRAIAQEEASDQPGWMDDNFSFCYDVATGKPRIDGPAFVEALRLLQRWQGLRAEPLAQDDPTQHFAAGNLALCVSDASWIAFLQQRNSPVRDRVGLAGIPGSDRYFASQTGREQRGSAVNRLPYLGSAGWLAVVPRSSPNAPAAFHLLASLTGKDLSTQIFLDARPQPRWAGGPIRIDPLEERVRWDAFDLDAPRTGDLREILRQTVYNQSLRNPVFAQRIPGARAHGRILAQELRSALKPAGTPADEALRRVHQGWESLDAQRPNHRAEYRLSQGLLPN